VPKEFVGKSGIGPHGDFIYHMDWLVGELLETLEDAGVADNTIVIFASDNGPEVGAVVNMRKDHDHDGARPWRGMKRDDWEGGHRTPFIVRWPGKVKAGSTTDQLTSLTDVFATCAAIAGAELPNDAAEDSYNMLGVLLGTQGEKSVREYLLEQSISLNMSIRHGKWKLLDHKGSGGNNYEKNQELRPFFIPDTEPDSPGQLYDLEADPGERENVYSKHPEIVAELKAKLEEFKASGRSAPKREGRAAAGRARQSVLAGRRWFVTLLLTPPWRQEQVFRRLRGRRAPARIHGRAQPAGRKFATASRPSR